MKTYSFKITGSDADGTPWQTSGQLKCSYDQVFKRANMETFEQLTEGKAVFGQPGKGCRGPYEIERVEIWLIKQ